MLQERDQRACQQQSDSRHRGEQSVVVGKRGIACNDLDHAPVEQLDVGGEPADGKAIPDKPVESRLSHRAPMHWQLQAVEDDRDRLGDRKGKHPCGNAARLSVSVG